MKNTTKWIMPVVGVAALICAVPLYLTIRRKTKDDELDSIFKEVNEYLKTYGFNFMAPEKEKKLITANNVFRLKETNKAKSLAKPIVKESDTKDMANIA
jgi:hypothetical protein